MSEEAKWYVVHTYSGYENKVKSKIEKVVENRNLQDLIPEVMIPSYVLVKMVLTDDSWYIVRNTRGVTGFVGPASKPVPLTDKEVGALGVDTQRSANVQVGFKEGDNVVVTAGSFEGFTGVVEKFDMEAQTADVRVSMLGRETTVTMPLTQIKSEE